jgi:hypothetical protein
VIPGTAALLQVKLVAAVLPVMLYVAVAPLQVDPLAVEVTTGDGFTVTVMICVARPGQAGDAVDVGVTIYCTVPAVLPLALTSVCAMVAPFPALAPLMLPVMVPMVQLKLLGVDEVSAMLVVAPLQIVAVSAVVTTGLGFTTTVIV